MQNRPATEHAEFEVKAARRKWNPALHPRDSQGRFIETGGTVRLWGGKLARVVRALPNDRILVQDQTGPDEFNGRRHTTSAKWVSMVARPDGSAPTDSEDKVVQEDEKRAKDPRRGNGLARDDDGDPDTPNDPHETDDRGRPIGSDEGDGPDDDDDQPEVVNIDHLPNRLNNSPGGYRFRYIADVRRHLLQLAEQPGQNPDMAVFLRSLAVRKDLATTANGRLIALRDDTTRRWYLTAVGTGQRMTGAGDFKDRNEASSFAYFLDHNVRSGSGDGRGPDSNVFDFTDPDLDEVARTWRSSRGENIQAAIIRARQEFDNKKAAPKKTAAKKTAVAPQRPPVPEAPAADTGFPATVRREALKSGDRVRVTVSSSDIEWPESTRNRPKPETVTVEGTVAPTFSGGPGTQGAPLVDVTLTGPDDQVMVSGDTARVLRMPGQVEISGHADGFTPEEIRADRVRVGDVIARGEFGHVVGRIDRYQGGRAFTTRNLGGRGEIDQFGTRPGDMLSVVPKARRRPEDVLRDVPDRTQQHPNSGDAKRAASRILSDWGKVNELAEQQWPDGAPEEFRALTQHMQNVTDAPKGADGYQQNADSMHGALAALHDLDTDGLDQDLAKALGRLEEGLDDNADRFAADSRAISEKKRKREAEAPKPEAPEASVSEGQSPSGEPLRHNWDDPEGLVTLTMPEALADFLNVEETAAMEDPDTRKALTEATRGRNGTLKVTAPIETHRALLEWAWTLAGGEGLDSDPKEVRAYNNYTKRVDEAEAELRKRQAEGNTDAPAGEAPEANDTADAGEQPPSGATPAAGPEPYDPSFQQQSDENGRITHYRTPQGVSRDIGGRFGVGEPVTTQLGETYIVVSGNDDGTINARKQPLYDDAPLGRPQTFQADELRTMDGFRPWRQDAAQAAAAEEGPQTPDAPTQDDPGVILSPDEVNAPAAAARASKAPSAMDDGEIRDEIVSLMEREMANGGELEGTDRTRLRVLEAEEAHRAGRKPPEEPKPKPKAPTEEPGGLFDVAPDEQQRFVADPNNPDDLADDPLGTPDMFADHEGRDTSRLRPPQSRKPADFQVGDRFVDADGRTYTVAEEPLRTPRGRIRVVDEDGQEHLLAPDRELRVLHPDEDAPDAPETDTANTNASETSVSEGEPPVADEPLIKGEWVTTANGDSGVIKRVYDERIGMGIETRRVADVEFHWGHRRPMLMQSIPVDRLTRRDTSDDSTQPASTPEPEPSGTSGDEAATARSIREGLPGLPALPKLGGLSRQDKDAVRRIRGDHEQIRDALDGIIAGDPPTGDSREDLRRVREQLDYVSSRLTRDLVPDSDEAQAVRAKLYDLGQNLDRALDAMPEQAPKPQGDGLNGGTLFHPWDLQDGDLVSFTAHDGLNAGLAPYYGTFRGASSTSHGRTLVTYEGREWNEDRHRWENGGIRHTVVMPQRGRAERFTPEEWDAWRRPGQSDHKDTADNATAPPAPIRETSPADMTDDDINAELEELQAWQNRHVSRTGEGPHIQGNAMAALSPVASRRGKLHEAQRQRDNARQDREKKEKEKQERAEALARAEIGKRNDDGSYPVTVDGEDAGTVSQLARKWRYTNADGQDSLDSYPSRAEAVAALVRNRDARRENADEDARREQARSEAPEGWTLGDRNDVAENDIIRVPITRQDGNNRPYPVGWRQPVRVNSVSRNDNGTMVLSVSNLDGSRSDVSPVFLSHPDDTFAWANDRTRPEPTPAWRHELRARMADIGDDIAAFQNREGLQDAERIQRLQDLIQRVSRGETDDLQGDLRQIRDEAAWLESQFDDPDLELPYETRRTRSWATAARMKAERDLRYPDFQNTDGDANGPDNAPDPNVPGDDDRATHAQGLFGEGMSAVGGASLPEMQELDDRLGRADSADDRDAELRDIADRMDALAEQYELAGPQGELAADRFRRAARIARGEQDDRDERRGDDEDQADDANGADGESDDSQNAPDSEDDEQQDDQDEDAQRQDDEENRRQRRDTDPDGGAADPYGGGAGAPGSPG
ncbi:hypothetical protein ACFRKC_27655, partial [Streptomyces chartreusis]